MLALRCSVIYATIMHIVKNLHNLFKYINIILHKVQLFWEGYKIWKINFPIFDITVRLLSYDSMPESQCNQNSDLLQIFQPITKLFWINVLQWVRMFVWKSNSSLVKSDNGIGKISYYVRFETSQADLASGFLADIHTKILE